ncbi:MAG: acetyl xylan esterase, partial [candidate division KSB1 bacterium]|nr:acetyl xylan esterase [candidate division KSB1 bacterium]
MKKISSITSIFIIFLVAFCCHRNESTHQTLFLPDHPNIRYVGRIDFTDLQKPKLTGAGAYFQVKFKGRSCALLLEDQGLWGNHGYIAVELDGRYQGRIRVAKDQTEYLVIQNASAGEHSLLVCKATEAQNGYIAVAGIRCEALLPITDIPQRRIEFIGNSITCGMGLDTEAVPCDSGTWYDQHNAYLAYGPLVARALHADWML